VRRWYVGGGGKAGIPRAVGGGRAGAVSTSGAGLALSVGALFPYNLFRAPVERTLSRLESLTAAAVHGATTTTRATTDK
jgi:hypothetical protein